MIIFISGASAGFGLAMSKRFAKLGHKVIAAARREEKLKELKKEFKENIFPLVLDVSNREQVQHALTNLPKEWSDVDILINNAGLALGFDSAQKSSLEDWETMVQTNINGILYLTHFFLPQMIKKNSGHIINLGSVAGEFPYPGGNVYGATKSFVHQFSLNLRADILGSKVRVTVVEPGMCASEFSQVRFKGDNEKAEAVYKGMQPLSAEDIAETVEWIMTRPSHVNINVISLMPIDQAFNGFAIHRKS
jgi:3-hydroxy acid dehydrogenase/malonic semialdehyde reductase